MIKKLINRFVYEGHLISLGATGIVSTFLILIDQKISIQLLIVIYLLAFLCLLYDRHESRKTDYLTNPDRTKCLEKYFKIIPLISILIVSITVLVLAFSGAFTSLLFILLLTLMMAFYTKCLKGLTDKIIGFKNIAFSLIVSLLLVFASIYYSYNFLAPTFAVLFVFCFLRMMANTIFLDIKDLKSDRKEDLKTIPSVFGRTKTMLILVLLNIASGFILILGLLFNLIPSYSAVLLLFILYSFYYFQKSKERKNFYLVNYVLADAEFILWPISLIIARAVIL
jgi:4-hydroxybenzoate polyprenyltransferase